MNRKAYRKSQVESALVTLGITPSEHRQANDGTLADKILMSSFDAESSARYQAKQSLLASLRNEITSNLNASRILDAVGTENAKATRHELTQAPAAFVPRIQ